MIDRATERKDKIVWDDLYKDEIAKVMYEFINEYWLSFDIDCCEWGSDYRLQQTVYVNKLVWDKWYNVILDCDFSAYFETVEEFVDKMIEAEEHTKKVLDYFKK